MRVGGVPETVAGQLEGGAAMHVASIIVPRVSGRPCWQTIGDP